MIGIDIGWIILGAWAFLGLLCFGKSNAMSIKNPVERLTVFMTCMAMAPIIFVETFFDIFFKKWEKKSK